MTAAPVDGPTDQLPDAATVAPVAAWVEALAAAALASAAARRRRVRLSGPAYDEDGEAAGSGIVGAGGGACAGIAGAGAGTCEIGATTYGERPVAAGTCGTGSGRDGDPVAGRGPVGAVLVPAGSPDTSWPGDAYPADPCPTPP